MDNTLDTIAHGLDEARAKIATTRQALQAAAPDEPEILRAIARLVRLEAEVAGVERRLAAQTAAAG